MDFNEIFEQFGIDPDDIEEAPDPPDFRATIRGRRLMVTSWAPHLLADGPQGNIVRERAENGVTVGHNVIERDVRERDAHWSHLWILAERIFRDDASMGPSYSTTTAS